MSGTCFSTATARAASTYGTSESRFILSTVVKFRRTIEVTSTDCALRASGIAAYSTAIAFREHYGINSLKQFSYGSARAREPSTVDRKNDGGAAPPHGALQNHLQR